jgi:hypothetical protein
MTKRHRRMNALAVGWLVLAVGGCAVVARSAEPAQGHSEPTAPAGPGTPSAMVADAGPAPSAEPVASDAGPLPPPGDRVSAGPVDGGAGDGGRSGASPPVGKPPDVRVGEPKFIGEGEVPDVDRFLDKTRERVAACVAEHGGVEGQRGVLEMQLLVTVRSRAEGVEVLSSEGLRPAAARCVREALSGKWIGAPTADPVGVSFRYEFTPAR